MPRTEGAGNKNPTTIEKIYKFLEDVNEVYTAEDLYRAASDARYIDAQYSTVYQNLLTAAKNDNKSGIVKLKSGRYALRKWEYQECVTENIDGFENIKEKDLHDLLAYFAFNKLKTLTKTISHSESKKTYGKWEHPDMVGFYLPFSGKSTETLETLKKLASILGESEPITSRIISFEIKRELYIANLRESFSQCLLNSTWAHESYLCAASIDRGGEFEYELGRLCNRFGLGVIEINLKDPDLTHIMIQAKQRPSLDWETVNKLMVKNPGFKEFINDASQSHEEWTAFEKNKYKVKKKVEIINFIKDIVGNNSNNVLLPIQDE